MIINSKKEIVMCPNCEGRGYIYKRTTLYDLDKVECGYCDGKRVVEEKTVVEHIKLDE